MRTGDDGTGLHAAVKVARYEDIDVVVCHLPGHFLSLLYTLFIQSARCLSLHNLRCVIHGLSVTHKIQSCHILFLHTKLLIFIENKE